MSIVIRRAVSDDWSAMKEIRLAALAEAPYAFGSTLDRELAFTEDTWRSRAADNLAFLGWQDQRLVGTATGFADPDVPPGSVRLVAMYVAPQARGTGCAHRLIDAVVDACVATGATQLVLDVTDVNAAAARCYRRYGFQQTGHRRPLGHSPQIAEIEMQLAIG
jgi:ribosomal protein S18 acetylase RimI-like enzyme